MNKNILIKKIIAGFIAFGTLAVGAIPVMAQNTYTPVQGGTVEFEKYLVFDSQANTPTATFTYSIAAGTAITPSAGKEAVLAGDDVGVTVHSTGDSTKTVIQNIALGTAVFAPTDTKYDSLQTPETGLGQQATLSYDDVDLGDEITTGHYEKSYSRHKVTVDFTKVQFTEPGVYRYVITETAMTAAQTELGLVIDPDATRYLDVYVKDNGFTSTGNNSGTGALEIVGYVLHNTDNFQPIDNSGESVVPTEPGTTKAKGFTNTYITYDLTLQNEVAGNQASTDKYFKYVVMLTDTSANSKYNVVLDYADATVRQNASTIDSYEGQTNASLIQTDANGDATYTFYLEHDQKLTIQGLPKNASYSITGTTEDYDGAAVIAGDTVYGKTGETAVAGVTSGTNNAKQIVIADTDINDDTTITVTNTRKGTIPTGVITSVLPGAAIVVLGIAGYAITRRKNEEE